MPWYKVDYHCGLSASQKGELAAAISDIHTKHFIAPKIFVNVQFQDISKDDIYVGGKPLRTNRIIGQVRGGSRSRESFEELCSKIVAAWNDIVQVPPAQADRSGPLSLHAISIQASIAAGYEGGFYQPAAGGDQEWVTKHWDEFQKRAGQGDEFASMIVENVSNDSNFVQSKSAQK